MKLGQGYSIFLAGTVRLKINKYFDICIAQVLPWEVAGVL